ncbi:MAG: 1-deoxy-D-xylulose-5-phosphate synthase N-terminal domain-containing protein [Candidatus Tectimicrobiota bacterium]
MADAIGFTSVSPATDPDTITNLETLAQRVLWLSTYMIHYANKVRPNLDGMKVGGHQASCASVVSLMTALYFAMLRPHDHVAVKPHASPVLHAIQYLLGRLAKDTLSTLRDFGGLQPYPSRTKDPDGVTISTGSVGLGAAATIFGALTQRYVRDHFGHAVAGRYIALVGDAEIDEGNVPEALGEASAYGLSDLWWIVDINRQSLDHIAPEGQVTQIARLFEAKGWEVLWLKYGSQQRAFFERPHGHWLKQWIDECTNAEYQSLLNADGGHIRQALLEWGSTAGAEMAQLLSEVDDSTIKALLMNLGGHDMPQILQTFAAASKVKDRPVAILAYTIKGWGLPIAGHIENHAAQLTAQHMSALQEHLGIASGQEWEGYAPDHPLALWIQQTQQQLARTASAAATLPRPPVTLRVPETLDIRFPERASTQGVFGHILVAFNDIKEVAARLITTSPDVAVSTNLANWINMRGIYARADRPNYWLKHGITSLLQWRETASGQHIELGIAENNLYLALAMFGLAQELHGELLLPIGTVYDPFVARGLDALTYATYAGAKFIFAGTPSGLSLNREGGAHQSIYTPLVGMGLPGLLYYEPAYAAELECILCWGLQQLTDRQHGQSLYLRLSTRPVTQAVRHSTPEWRRQVLAGGYWLRDYRTQPDYSQRPRVHIFAAGVMLEEALQASDIAADDGIYANVINITSADRLFRTHFEATQQGAPSYLDELLPSAERDIPAITLLDGHPLTLAWLGALLRAPLKPLGVVNFGEAGSLQQLYHKHHIDTDAVLSAMVQLLFGHTHR